MTGNFSTMYLLTWIVFKFYIVTTRIDMIITRPDDSFSFAYSSFSIIEWIVHFQLKSSLLADIATKELRFHILVLKLYI